MTPAQSPWWEQARSDLAVYGRLLPFADVEPCHKLHYLQMFAEKLGKAYLWRHGRAPTLSHAALTPFLRELALRSESDIVPLAAAAGFGRGRGFLGWLPGVFPLAHDLERLAPALAADGPNAEYPWPHDAPAHAPAGFAFPLWRRLNEAATGRQFVSFLAAAVRTFPTYA